MSELIISISGVRGIIGDNLGPREGAEFGLAYGSFLGQLNQDQTPSKVCIGRDGRPSGQMLSAAMSSGLMAAGCETIDLGIVTTPGTALMTRFLSCRGGVVITASHNPVEYNGIKFLRHDGIAYPEDQVKQIHQRYYAKDFVTQRAQGVAGAGRNSKAHAVHVDSVLQICDKTLIRSRRFRVVLDSINGAGCVVTAQLLAELGCDVIHLNGRPTGIFAHRPEPTAEDLSELGPQIIKHGAVVGFAQDPDADRLAVIDEQGRYIGEEYTLALAAKYMFRKKAGLAAANLSTSRMIDDLAAAAGCAVIRTPVGEAHVAKAMLENNCIIGGEGNGGVIDPRVVPVRDSLVGIVMILQLLAETGKTVSELVGEIPCYHMLKRKFPCPPEETSGVLEAVRQHYETSVSGEKVKIDTRDGIRVDLDEGWIHVRASNTEPIMRIIAESSDPERAKRLADQIRAWARI
ncbi:MAG: hypothetical protein AMJ79_04590 [Phycisphaerae bacterium SM23_30]|nr:MAG: hypothetical protein AMJ79_04590 [Phycisphaerae bacterium SM23_30]